MNHIAYTLILGILISVSLAQESAAEKWNRFKSSTGFTVEYPSTWFRKDVSKDELLILSSRGGAQAIIIRSGQGSISVSEEQKYLNSPMSQAIDYYLKDTEVLSRKTIHNENAGAPGCRGLEEIILKQPVTPPEDVPGPVPHEIDTLYFCEVNGRKYVTIQRNFEGDKKQAMYQKTALRVAQSLRAVE